MQRWRPNIFERVGEALFVRRGSSAIHDYNLFYDTPPLSEWHRVVADPLLVGTSDFHLRSGSPAIDKGDNGALVPIRSSDLDGKPPHRVVDIGAYEAP
jgi:hypothetical protein